MGVGVRGVLQVHDEAVGLAGFVGLGLNDVEGVDEDFGRKPEGKLVGLVGDFFGGRGAAYNFTGVVAHAAVMVVDLLGR